MYQIFGGKLMKPDTNRATGRTTGLMLQAIGRAVKNPGTEVEFIDHHEQNFAQLQMCKERIEDIAKKLNLDITVRVYHYYHEHQKEEWKLLVKSNLVSPYSQRTPVEEAFKNNYGVYPNELETTDDFNCWKSFKRGFEAAQDG
jgi:hypothetical protein